MRTQVPVNPVHLTSVIHIGTDVDALRTRLPYSARRLFVVRSHADVPDAIAVAADTGPRLICVTTSLDDAVEILRGVCSDEDHIARLVNWYEHPDAVEVPSGDGPLVPVGGTDGS